jgi:hypothetical protein
MNNWDADDIEDKLNQAFENNSEIELLEILKNNSFLFYYLYSYFWNKKNTNEFSMFHKVFKK